MPQTKEDVMLDTIKQVWEEILPTDPIPDDMLDLLSQLK